MTERIDEKDLPRVSPAPTAHLRAVQGGKSVLVPLPQVENAAALVAEAIDAVASSGAIQMGEVADRVEQEANILIAQAKYRADVAMAAIGLLPPVAYDEGILVDTARFTVEYNGAVFAPYPSAVPFTTGAEFNPGVWRLVQAVTAVELSDSTGAGMVGFRRPFTGAVTRSIADWIGSQPVDPKDFGGIADGTAHTLAEVYETLEDAQEHYPFAESLDDYIDFCAWQAALNTGRNVLASPGAYVINRHLSPIAGQKIAGQVAPAFSASTSARVTSVYCDAEGEGCFWYVDDNSTGQKAAPQYDSIYLRGDYPIINNLTDEKIDLSDSPIPYLMQAHIQRCTLKPRVQGVGRGIQLSKCFDSSIMYNNIEHFDINLLLHGCDIGLVMLNRIMYGHSYDILEQSAQTFGSQIEIKHNDVLYSPAGVTDKVFIKTSSRQVRVRDNYLEALAPCKGFIDISKSDSPEFGDNVPSDSLSIVVDHNRIDGQHHATDFVYRLRSGATYVKIHDANTTGVKGDAPGLLVEGDGLDALRNVNNTCQYDIQGERFGEWRSFKSDALRYYGDALTIDAMNLHCVGAASLYANNAYQHIRYRGRDITLLSTLASPFYMNLPAEGSVNNPYFRASATYEVTVEARTTSASGDTLQLTHLRNNTGGSFVSFSLTQQRQICRFTFRITDLTTSDVLGIAFIRTTSNGDIRISSVSIREVYGAQISFDPPERAAGSQSGGPIEVTVPGAVMGDIVDVSFSNDLQGTQFWGYVSSANTVHVFHRNGTASAVNLAPGTLRVRIRK